MTIEEGNNLIAKYLKLNLKSDKETWELSSELSNIFKVKTTKCLRFNENINSLIFILKKFATIKDMIVNIQFSNNEVGVFLYYKAQDIEGELRFCKFSTSREKEINKLNQALFEVIVNFCGWLDHNKECQSEIEYELDHVENGYANDNMYYYKPKNLVCPHCHKEIDYEELENKLVIK